MKISSSSSSFTALLIVVFVTIATVTLLSRAPTSNLTAVVVANEIVPSIPIEGPSMNVIIVKESNIEPATKTVKRSDKYRRSNGKGDDQKRDGEAKHVVGGRKSMKFRSAVVADETSTASSSFKTSKHNYGNDARDLVAFTSDYRSPRHHPPKNN